ncbi:MAG: DUF4062 domain-containing protein [Lachnospiraceae bacterium]|nr:DUF4062 domain-containing protein [Lachnospiraceae bacterium]
MKPRIFISSTFYDLKYIREDLANFVRSYGYESVLFEDGDIGYTPGKSLDASCYESMRNSDMVILIIGGEYGSAASGEKKDEFKEYMSVTRKEFRTATESGIPVFVMIDKKVMAEYGVYEANYVSIEKENMGMAFPVTKSINVFRFIKEVKSIVNLPIQEFEKSSDIKVFISKQWSDMFKNYLTSLRNGGENKKIENSVNEMKNLIQKMNIMLDSVGKNVLSKNSPKEYEDVVNQQEVVSFCNILIDSFTLELKSTDELIVNNKREEIIHNFLKSIQKINDNDIIDIKEELTYVLDIINGYGFETRRITSHFGKISEKIKLLNDRKNIEKVVELMSSDEYFNKLIKII